MSIKRLQVCDLSDALVRMGRDFNLLKAIVEIFREDSGVILRNLKQAVVGGDAMAVQRAAHGLRGLIANFNAAAAAEPALRLEQIGKSGDLTGAAAVLQQFEQELERLNVALTADLRRMEVGTY
jgi:HPt (histidine-containing phosphotransfer) domain-containing protein